jgi:hypothetical protein
VRFFNGLLGTAGEERREEVEEVLRVDSAGVVEVGGGRSREECGEEPPDDVEDRPASLLW